ncbi:MAG: hypothetical protein PHH77_03965 [Victivallaceae bacterium]|nr:hypothetical protein [Victivallaceae bacterium]
MRNRRTSYAENGKKCRLCPNTGSLTYRGLFGVYLWTAKTPVAVMLIGLIGAVACSPYFYLLFIIGLVLPLAQADFRLYLYPVAVIAKLAGKKLNCPECSSGGTMYQKYLSNHYSESLPENDSVGERKL